MKILLDPQIFIQKYGGISRYHTETWRILKNYPDIDINCPLIYSDNLHLQEYNLTPQISRNLSVQNEPLRKILNGFNCLKTLATIANKKFDVFIPTYYYPYFLNYLGNKPYVLTVYDMINELYPNYFGNDKKIDKKRILIEKASKIIAISENTKLDILKIYPYIDEKKIEIVYLSHSIDTNNISDETPVLPKNYLLFIGNRNFYKNFTFFIKSISKILKEDSSLFLVCGGGGKFTQEEIELLSLYDIKEKVIQFNFKDNQLFHLYKNANAFIFPSEYEGFGIPVLEAMACECPIILTNCSSLPEVAGKAGIYFENNNSSDLSNKIKDVIYNKSYRDEMIRKGKEQEKMFSWDKTAAQCLEIYKSVI